MSSKSENEFEEKPHHILLPARVLLPGDSAPDDDGDAGTLEDEDGGVEVDDSNINGWTVRAVFEIDTPDEGDGEGFFISLRFGANTDVYDSTSEYLEFQYFHSFHSNMTWHTGRKFQANALQESAGEPYARPWVDYPPGTTNYDDNVGPIVPGSNEIVIKVVGTQATFELNGVVIGFLAYEFWPLMTNVYAAPDKNGDFYETPVDYRRLVSLEAKRYVPPLAWGIFGAAGGVALVALLAMAVAK